MQGMETVKQSGPWNSLGAHGSLVVICWLCISSRVKPENFTFKSYLTLPQKNNRDLHQGIFYLWSKFGDPSLNGWWVMVRTNSKWGKFGLQVKFHLEGTSVHKIIGTLTKVFCIFGPNLVIIAWTGPGYRTNKNVIDTQTERHTHTHTDVDNDNTRRPKLASGKNKFWSMCCTQVCSALTHWPLMMPYGETEFGPPSPTLKPVISSCAPSWPVHTDHSPALICGVVDNLPDMGPTLYWDVTQEVVYDQCWTMCH